MTDAGTDAGADAGADTDAGAGTDPTSQRSPPTHLALSPSPPPSPPPSLVILSIASKLIQEPLRALPLTAVALYIPIVFFSNGILPGLDGVNCKILLYVYRCMYNAKCVLMCQNICGAVPNATLLVGSFVGWLVSRVSPMPLRFGSSHDTSHRVPAPSARQTSHITSSPPSLLAPSIDSIQRPSSILQRGRRCLVSLSTSGWWHRSSIYPSHPYYTRA